MLTTRIVKLKRKHVMVKTENFWKVVQAGVAAFWLAIPAFFLGGISMPLLVILGVILLVLHTLELPVAFIKLRGMGVPPVQTVVKTLLYGFTWWLPLSKGFTKA